MFSELLQHPADRSSAVTPSSSCTAAVRLWLCMWVLPESVPLQVDAEGKKTKQKNLPALVKFVTVRPTFETNVTFPQLSCSLACHCEDVCVCVLFNTRLNIQQRSIQYVGDVGMLPRIPQRAELRSQRLLESASGIKCRNISLLRKNVPLHLVEESNLQPIKGGAPQNIVVVSRKMEPKRSLEGQNLKGK